jgi:histone H3/H4
MVRIKQTAVKSLDGIAKRKQFGAKSMPAKKKNPEAVKKTTTDESVAMASDNDKNENNDEVEEREVVHVKGKRRFKSGTVATREIKKYTKSTNFLFPKAPFDRLVREVAQDFSSSIRFSSSGMLAIHEASEQFITEKFIKADMARRHAKRKTLHIDDVRFTPYMTHITSEIVGNKLVG